MHGGDKEEGVEVIGQQSRETLNLFFFPTDQQLFTQHHKRYHIHMQANTQTNNQTNNRQKTKIYNETNNQTNKQTLHDATKKQKTFKYFSVKHNFTKYSLSYVFEVIFLL